MNELYAIVDGENTKVATISDGDSDKIGRGYEVGYSFGIVTTLLAKHLSLEIHPLMFHLYCPLETARSPH